MNKNLLVARIGFVLLFLFHVTALSAQAGGRKEASAAAFVQVQRTTASQSGSPDKPGRPNSRSDEIRRIDSRLEMFVDDYLIERLTGPA